MCQYHHFSPSLKDYKPPIDFITIINEQMPHSETISDRFNVFQYHYPPAGGLRVQKDYNLGQNQLFTVCATCSFLIILKPIDMVKKADFCPN